MLSVFGDESYDEIGQRVFAVAGVVGTQEEWNALESVWLERTGGKPFHAADCESSRGEYKGISHEENLKLYKDLVQILARTKLMGYGIAMDLRAYEGFFPDVVKNIPYCLCFSRVVMHFARLASLHVPQEKVKFTFHLNAKTNFSSGLLYDYMTNLPEWEWRFSLYLAGPGELSFASRKSIGIQVADIVAREAMKHCDNFFVSYHNRRGRKSLQVLSATGRYPFDFLSREYFESYKKQFDSLEEKAGFNREDYRQWLLKNKLDDNLANRHRFLLSIVSLETEATKQDHEA